MMTWQAAGERTFFGFPLEQHVEPVVRLDLGRVPLEVDLAHHPPVGDEDGRGGRFDGLVRGQERVLPVDEPTARDVLSLRRVRRHRVI
jgi:hypothetical protein